MSDEFSHLKVLIQEEEKIVEDKRSVVRNLDMFVLDNSLRESTVGQVRGHTLDDKFAILTEVKKCGFNHIVISAFSHADRVDDEFAKQLCDRKPDPNMNYYAFSEIRDGNDLKKIPIGLQKMNRFGIKNPIFEIDLAQSTDPSHCEETCSILKERIEYAHSELSQEAKVLVNLRDFPFAMDECPDRVFRVVQFLAKLPTNKRPFGIIYEEPTGRYLPELLGGWTKAIRALMDENDWRLLPDNKGGHLLCHIHKKWDFSEATQIECLSTGANGVWASVCEEGAALGHACSIVSIMNLIRLGNQKVAKKYKCTYLREAAINVTKLTTGELPHPKQTIYGERALDLAFGFGRIAGGTMDQSMGFDLAKFFGIDPPVRISTLASKEMVQQRLVDLFGEHSCFTLEIAEKMKAVMTQDLNNNRKEEYMSHVGLALLFDRAGGHITAGMMTEIAKVSVKEDMHKKLLAEVRDIWDRYDLLEEEKRDNCLEFHSFYNAFMAPHFGCYECKDAKMGLKAIDMDSDGKVDWDEFCVYLKWALNEYPDICTVPSLLTTAFTRGLIPAMQDEIVKRHSDASQH
jgi:isopropylmalate/homocitrate/citramalate synthase